ncbi:CDP-alcohol phosphatidyltransferase family protein [Gordonia sp. OPL2]|nr:CDP-alcohol phosphatidyltransferase family protein [Gordonia sp. OPL2]
MSDESADREATYDDWSRMHGHIDPRTSVWIKGWVVLSHRIARPLSRLGVSPNVITVCGVVLTMTAVGIATAGRWWPALAALLIVVGAVLDGVDGALAAQRHSTGGWGTVLDTLADRCCDLLLVAMLILLGAPLWSGIVIGVATLLLESVRATAQTTGMVGPGTLTVWERPSRVVLAVLGAAGAAVLWWAGGWSAGRFGMTPDPRLYVTGLGALGAVLSVVGLIQLLVAIRPRVRDLPQR